MNIRRYPEYIPFMEALITFAELFPTDLVLYGITLNTLQIPTALETHIKAEHGEGTRATRIKQFQWALDTYPFHEVKERLYDAMVRSGMVLRYRTFIRDYNLNILRPESETRPTSCFSFLSCQGRQ